MVSRYDQIDLAAVAAEWRGSAGSAPGRVDALPVRPSVGPVGLGPSVVSTADIGDLLPDEVFNGFGPRERLFAGWQAALPAAAAAAAADVSVSTIRRWADDGLAPRSAWFPGRPRRWSFADIVRARTARRLRQGGASVAAVREAFALVSWELPARFVLVGGQVVVDDGSGEPVTASGQMTLAIGLEDVAAEVRTLVTPQTSEGAHDGLRLVVGASR